MECSTDNNAIDNNSVKLMNTHRNARRAELYITEIKEHESLKFGINSKLFESHRKIV